MLQDMLNFFTGFFLVNPTILGWGLALLFALIWLACYRPPMISKPWLWAVLVGGAIMAPIAISITTYPLGYGISKLITTFWNQQTILGWGWLISIPSILIFGLVWEGAKLVPVSIYWWRKGKDIDPKFGLLIGAVAGAGFGIILAAWTNNYFMYETSWSWQLVQIEGLTALSGFWESLFILGLNIGSTALAGWGLAKGWGWKFYLIAAAIYLVTNYSTVLINYEFVSANQAQLIISLLALILVGVTLWLRYREQETLTKTPVKTSRKTVKKALPRTTQTTSGKISTKK
ncbi:MAG TPA: hypothetical protein VF366_02415 [Dehalococcoidia bacterium]